MPSMAYDSTQVFLWAESEVDCLNDLYADTLREPFSANFYNSWPTKSIPGVTIFSLYKNASVDNIYAFHTNDDQTSPFETGVVGVRNEYLSTTTWAFGFHLWYMEHDAARQLIDNIMNPLLDSEGCFNDAFYVATTGNDETNDGSQGQPFATIQKAVDEAGWFDTVWVESGTYFGGGNRDIEITQKNS